MSSPSTRFDVAVFPLMNTVLFPGVTLPIQVRDRRYGRLLGDLRAAGRPVAVSLLVPDGEEGKEFRLSQICGSGDLEIFKTYPDGRSDVLVHGRRRVRLRSVLQRDPYLVMEVEPLEEPWGPRPRRAPSPVLETLLSLIRAWVFLNPSFSEDLSLVFDEFTEEAAATDFFAFHFLKRAEDQQIYLNCTNPAERALQLSAYLRTDLIRLNRKLRRGQKQRLIH